MTLTQNQPDYEWDGLSPFVPEIGKPFTITGDVLFAGARYAARAFLGYACERCYGCVFCGWTLCYKVECRAEVRPDGLDVQIVRLPHPSFPELKGGVE